MRIKLKSNEFEARQLHDREQLGRMIDVLYETFRDGICDRRGMTHAEFDAIARAISS